MYKVDLNSDWMLRDEELDIGPEMISAVQRREDGWMNTDLPSDIHMALIENKRIEEPLEKANFYKCEWTEHKSWWYKKVFTADKDLLAADAAELTLESLDAEADIFLNGIYLGHQKSAFYPFSENISKFLLKGENTITVRLTSGLEHVSEQDIAQIHYNVSTEEGNGKPDRGDKRRSFIRKPQYVFGWDWSPRIATCGIMKSVYIKAYNKVAIRAVHAVTVSAAEDSLISIDIETENLHPFSCAEAYINLSISLRGDEVFVWEKPVFLKSGLNYSNIKAEIKDAELWWPNGMGPQPLYNIKVSVLSGDNTDEYPEFRFGIRTIVINSDNVNGNEHLFAFEVNGIKTFCKGGNWIPADAIYARITDNKYEKLIKEAADANFTMLRIWGGGLYERDVFYDKCDEYGIMIWHDMMFACAIYPDRFEWFRREIEKELDYQTARLRNHASLALWCGNNEISWAFDEWWKDRDVSPDYGGSICYNKIAPAIIRKNCPEIFYWNSSPYGGTHPNGSDTGDRHHWADCTMNPEMEKRITPEEYDKVTSKFISEYGYIGPCSKSSILKYHAGAEPDRNGEIWQHHNNTFEKNTVAAGIKKHYTDPEILDMDEYLLYAGLCQGLMYSYSLESFRSKDNCWGGLFWMYDDCWGEVGWTIIDYYLKRKPSYYYVKRAFMPKKLILREDKDRINVTGINETEISVVFEAEYGYGSFDGSIKPKGKTIIKLEPYSRRTVFEFKNDGSDILKGAFWIKPVLDNSDILPAILRSAEFRKLDMPKAVLEIFDYETDGSNIKFKISCDTYAHAVHFGLDDSIIPSDEYFDLLPGEKREIEIYSPENKIRKEDIYCRSI